MIDRQNNDDCVAIDMFKAGGPLYGKLQSCSIGPYKECDDIGDIEQYDLQMNYIMKGHNARTSAVFSELDNGQSKSYAFTLGGQWQF